MMFSLFRRVAVLVLTAFFATGAAYAQVGDKLDDFWDGITENANVTSPRAVVGQQGGYFTGGSLVFRAPQEDIRLVNLTAPSVRAGCGGIDIYTGGFSFIDADQFVASLRAIASNAAGYAFQLGIETLCPQCAEQIDKLNAMAQLVNDQSIESCEAAQGLVNSVWPKSARASTYICENASRTSGIFSDHVESRHNCNKEGESNALNSADPDSAARDPINKNLAWEAIKQLPFARSGGGDARMLAELAMSLTGTTIMRQGADDLTPSYEPLPPKGDSDQLFNAIFAGGAITYFKCTDWTGSIGTTPCLTVIESTTNINANQALGTRASVLITSMLSKLAARESLSADEEALLNATSIPLYKMLSVSYAHKGGAAFNDVPMLAEYVGVELVTEFITTSMREATSGVPTAELASLGDEYKDWRDRASEVEALLETRRSAMTDRVQNTSQLIENYRVIEAVLAKRLEVQLARQFSSSMRGE